MAAYGVFYVGSPYPLDGSKLVVTLKLHASMRGLSSSLSSEVSKLLERRLYFSFLFLGKFPARALYLLEGGVVSPAGFVSRLLHFPF